jgi:cell division protein FtsI (penicillin-binding protein 3)
MNIKDAVYLCEKLGLRISVSGKGKVINQSVVEGSKIGLGQTVSIQLN